MATVHADYQERKRIVFTARGREQVNVREMTGDGPIGYTSTELLLIALGNCTLGALLNQEILKEAAVVSAEATLSAEMAQNPVRVKRIDVAIDLAVADPALIELQEELEAVACTCPICNTLGSVEIVSTVKMRVAEPAAA
jgi:uncharacterized OsmC-like protein